MNNHLLTSVCFSSSSNFVTHVGQTWSLVLLLSILFILYILLSVCELLRMNGVRLFPHLLPLLLYDVLALSHSLLLKGNHLLLLLHHHVLDHHIFDNILIFDLIFTPHIVLQLVCSASNYILLSIRLSFSKNPCVCLRWRGIRVIRPSPSFLCRSSVDRVFLHLLPPHLARAATHLDSRQDQRLLQH